VDGGQLVSHGLAVYSIDLRGRGKSDGERFYVQKFEDYVNDIATFVQMVKSQEQGLPVFMLGHSAGVLLHAFTHSNISLNLQVLFAKALRMKFPRLILLLQFLRD